MGIGPVPAIRRLTERTGTKLADYDAVELNEAFAAQVLACDRDLHFDRARLNPNGGAIALGHPIACTGSRILTTLIHEIRRPSKCPGKLSPHGPQGPCYIVCVRRNGRGGRNRNSLIFFKGAFGGAAGIFPALAFQDPH